MTGGMCWEALNNIGAAPQRPMVILLNDNGRSYLPTVGGFATTALRGRGVDGETGRNLFRDLGLEYLGPIDGHDLIAIEGALQEAADLNRPVVVHCVTSKGRGYAPAEQDDHDRFHAVGVIDSDDGRAGRSGGARPGRRCSPKRSRRSVKSVRTSSASPRRCSTRWGWAALRPGFRDRVFDIGIAEQHAVTSAAGLAIGGMHPVVAIYAAFIGRALDQLIMDVALHQLAGDHSDRPGRASPGRTAPATTACGTRRFSRSSPASRWPHRETRRD